MPSSLLFAAVLAFATLGIYTLNNSVFDVFVVYALGVVAFFLRKHSVPLAPVVLGVVLGPLLEQQFRRAVAISGGDVSVFVTRPVSAAILLCALAAVTVPSVVRYVTSRPR